MAKPDETVNPSVTQLLVDVYMGEYAALRKEMLLHMQRVSNLLVYSIAGTGALVGSTAVTSFTSRPDVFASVLLLVSAVLALVAATCVGTVAKIRLINGYLADRADEIRGLLRSATGEASPISADAFSWERQSINVAGRFFSKSTLRSWGGSILEILLIAVLAIAALIAAAYVYAQQEAARTPVTTVLLALDLFVEVAILIFGAWVAVSWSDSKSPAKESPTVDARKRAGGRRPSR